MTPVLQTLLESVSTDTIHSLAFILLSLSFATFEYKTTLLSYNPQTAIVLKSGPDTLAFTSALLATLCLISRFTDPMKTFAVIYCSVFLFAMWPEVAHFVRLRYGKAAQIYLTLFLGFIAHFAAWSLALHGTRSDQLILLFFDFFLTIFINLIFPLLLVRYQSNKSNIHGPWDEATMKE
ncbi:hypothetical protein Ciccas_001549 [Cichlidogyrus casuarinus]|uniref:Uncharacterized protein n=1 Tax=Cichlidogyrus casuarinus TaxID=1844966 RepID=A0ABD2QJR4_9PLAT